MNLTRWTTAAAVALASNLLAAAPAAAWGAKAESAIVSTALALLSKGGNVPLTRLEREVREGALSSDAQLREAIPALATGQMAGIQSEVALLQAVRGERVDPYYAHRLGALGKLIARATAPMADAPTVYRNLYYADVENALTRAALETRARRIVDIPAYLPPLMSEAAQNDATIEREYQSGIGFKGIAGTAFTRDVNRSVAAVADVWFTVLTGTGASGTASEAQRRDYVIRAYRFYIDRGNNAELDAMAARLNEISPPTPDMQVRIGDLYYESGMAERAIREYEAVLAREPNRKEVSDRIAAYYLAQGERALDTERLENARDLFARAADANPLHPNAERMRLEADSLIGARDQRQAMGRALIARAEGIFGEAEQEALRGRFAEAVALLRQAEETYREVSDEFPSEASTRDRALRDISFRLQDYRSSLLNNALAFSGTGAEYDLRAAARERGRELDRQLLESIARDGYAQALRRAEERAATSLSR